MIAISYTSKALKDMELLADFLFDQSEVQAANTPKIIVNAVEILAEHPLIGRVVANDHRELVISRGQSGYVALYRYDGREVTVVAIRHQRETGFRDE